ncbi:hypothetical protein H6771_02500 [Candidatus Peribacteria bacterium]|nr:hypothetical protein [Candidatus Peribacteria bacterium]
MAKKDSYIEEIITEEIDASGQAIESEVMDTGEYEPVIEPNQYGDVLDAPTRLITALSYVSVLFVIPLLMKKDTYFSQLHAKQGMLLFFFYLVYRFIKIFERWEFFIYFGGLLYILYLVLVILGIFQVLRGNYFKFPLLGWAADFLVFGDENTGKPKKKKASKR